MKEIGRCKLTSLLVLSAFSTMTLFAGHVQENRGLAPAPGSGKAEMSRDGALQPQEPSSEAGAGSIEKQSKTSSSTVTKRGRFPWLLVVGVVVAGGLAYYFLVMNKQYTLTVSAAEGVTGVPANGTAKYKKGSSVNYSFSLQSGYKNLSVTLDGSPAASVGTITMNGNHALAVTAVKKSTYTLSVTRGQGVNGLPEGGTYTYEENTTVAYNYSLLSSGYSYLKVLLDGIAVSPSGSITMNGNHTLVSSAQQNSVCRLTVEFFGTITPSGTPAVGIYYYQFGTTVNYSYTISSSNYQFIVLLDGDAVCEKITPATCSGSFVMDKDRSLQVQTAPH